MSFYQITLLFIWISFLFFFIKFVIYMENYMKELNEKEKKGSLNSRNMNEEKKNVLLSKYSDLLEEVYKLFFSWIKNWKIIVLEDKILWTSFYYTSDSKTKFQISFNIDWSLRWFMMNWEWYSLVLENDSVYWWIFQSNKIDTLLNEYLKSKDRNILDKKIKKSNDFIEDLKKENDTVWFYETFRDARRLEELTKESLEIQWKYKDSFKEMFK